MAEGYVLPMAAINSAVRSVASWRRAMLTSSGQKSGAIRPYLRLALAPFGLNQLRQRDNLKSSVLTGNAIDHRGHAAAIGNVNEIGAASSQLCPLRVLAV